MTTTHKLSALKDAAIASLYEHLLTAEADAYWFQLEDVREQIRPKPSGALLQIALMALQNDDQLVEITYEGGEDVLFTLTAEGIEVAEELHSQFFETSSDIVDVSSQRNRIEEVRTLLDQLETELRENNEISSSLESDEKDLLVGEVAAAQVLAGRERFRLSRLIFLIMPMLKFISDKFARAAIGELAKQLMKLLLS